MFAHEQLAKPNLFKNKQPNSYHLKFIIIYIYLNKDKNITIH